MVCTQNTEKFTNLITQFFLVFFQTWGSEESIIANGSFCMTISDKWIAKEKALILQIFATFTRKVDRDWEVETNSWTSIRKNLLSPNL